MIKATISPEIFFSEETLFADDGLLNDQGLEQNNALLFGEFDWLSAVFYMRIKTIRDENTIPIEELGIPALPKGKGPLFHLTENFELSLAERILLLLTLEPHFQPSLVTSRVIQLSESDKTLAQAFGYYRDPFSGNYYPTLQTVLFLCAGNNPPAWRKYEQDIIHRGRLFREQIVTLRDPDERMRIGNRVNFLIDLAQEYVDYLLHGRKPRPDFGRGFPARLVTTNLSWNNLVLNDLTKGEISDVMDWVEYGKEVVERSGKKVNHSFPCLFYGPPGTGKSFTAKLIGKQYGKDVFRIDLSMIVSKYIGETEKNLASLFDRAEGKGWILFFDEADALFGKRTGISDSNDKWANLEMSYLLQRMEEYEGLCILASNLKHNLDPALTRRFQALIHFPFPKVYERAQIWEKSIPPGFAYPENIDFAKLARYELSGAGIANVMKASAVKATRRGDYTLSTKDISRFIRIEYAKDNRTI